MERTDEMKSLGLDDKFTSGEQGCVPDLYAIRIRTFFFLFFLSERYYCAIHEPMSTVL